jgi:hypothetical protein
VAVISVADDGHGPLAVPIWYSYQPGGEVRIITGRTSRKGELLERAGRFSLCVQTETLPYKYVSVENTFGFSTRFGTRQPASRPVCGSNPQGRETLRFTS